VRAPGGGVDTESGENLGLEGARPWSDAIDASDGMGVDRLTRAEGNSRRELRIAPLSRVAMREPVLSRVNTYIVDSGLQPGDRLPSERELAVGPPGEPAHRSGSDAGTRGGENDWEPQERGKLRLEPGR
jgi:hypothetical protein